jgi:hypothetical protein
MRCMWVEFRGKVGNRERISLAFERLFSRQFEGKIIEIKPHFGYGHSPDDVAHTVVTIEMDIKTASLEDLVLALRCELEPHGIGLTDWDEIVPADGLWIRLKNFLKENGLIR